MPLNYHIREMRQEDLTEVTDLEASCFSMPWKYKDFEETLTNPDRVYLVAEADNAETDASDRILGDVCSQMLPEKAILQMWQSGKHTEETKLQPHF